MKKTKKFLAAILVFCLVLSLAACGDNSSQGTQGSNQSTGSKTDSQSSGNLNQQDSQKTPEDTTSKEAPKETVTLNVYSQLANYSGEQVGWFAAVMKEKFNVILNIIPNADGRFATLLESGNLGDIVIFGNDTDDYQAAIAANMLYDWEEDDLLDEYGAYIKANFGKALEKNRNLSADGTLYGYGYNVAQTAQDHEAFFYYPELRFDLYQQIGSPKMETLESYIDVLEQMVAVCPTSDTGAKTYGVSMFPDWDGDMVMYVKSTGALYGYDEFGFGLYNVNTQTYEPCLNEDSMYMRSLKFYNKLYQKGLVDPDSMTQTYNDVCEAYQTGAAFFCLFTFLGSASYNTTAHKDAGKAMLALPADDFKNICYGLNPSGGNRVWTIGSKTQYPELCMEIINWLSTPEGRMTIEYGPKGDCWNYDENGAPYLTELGAACKDDKETVMTGKYAPGSIYKDGTFQPNNVTWSIDAKNPDAEDGSTFNYVNWNSTLSKDKSDVELAWSKFVGGYVSPDAYLEAAGHISVAPGTTFTGATKSKEMKVIWDQIAEEIKNSSWKAIYAKNDKEFEFIVKQMRTKCYSYGYQECVDFYEKETARRRELENVVLGR
ncbi:MAG: extracellular solute-binding protein [Lachnospiraceae bacterium]|nr:extracellular solute-binding protein [Lachnospiraceae bacterium]